MPTQLIKKYLEEFATWIRNDDKYDDWDYGTEVIPGDKTWAKKSGCKKCGDCNSCPIQQESSDTP